VTPAGNDPVPRVLREPTEVELSAMAYVDGELGSRERAAFEARLEREPALVREVAAQQRLAVLARAAAPLEPIDREWAAIERSMLTRAGLPFSWALLALGVAGLATWCAWEVACCPIGWIPKVLTAAIASGFLLLFVLALRTRLRTKAFDPYDDVRR
jgi:anti-sigma factor RsiW